MQLISKKQNNKKRKNTEQQQQQQQQQNKHSNSKRGKKFVLKYRSKLITCYRVMVKVIPSQALEKGLVSHLRSEVGSLIHFCIPH